ncbi:MAG: MBL fold metallo-hydrolase [Psychroserpens sp.]|uniref:MBL fold metallo-hydrolase n=1 Tax=Psychroserpens sp. TaxID=2020870 RepID=UPI003C7187E3
MKFLNLLLVFCFLTVASCQTEPKEQASATIESNTKDVITQTDKKDKVLTISPISHATMVLSFGSDDIYVDPTGGSEAFKAFTAPEIVLITDIHGDHFDVETLQALDLSAATIIAPKAVMDKFPTDLKFEKSITLDNGDTTMLNDYKIEAIPMYNLRKEALKFHTKGRGNGYVLTVNDERIYISGDTEDIPEMRNLKNIDRAFVCMNLPYTMTVDKAAEAVLEFKPKMIYPYHYRGQDGMSDIEKFKTLINQGNETIEVVQLEWYN